MENNTSWYSEGNTIKCLTWRLLREKKLFVGRFAKHNLIFIEKQY